MNDYNNGALPEPCLRLNIGFGQQYKSVDLGDGTGYMRLDLIHGTCHLNVEDNMAETEGMGDAWLECDECHWQMPLEPSTPIFNYCPGCGRKAVDAGWTHRHAPTVEDVLREFALDIDPSADVDISGKPIIERFAAKLQLKEHE